MACGFGAAPTVARTSRIAARRNLPGKGDAWKAGVASLESVQHCAFPLSASGGCVGPAGGSGVGIAGWARA